jgi:23S rRNA pseudouridine2604 synthase
MQDKPNDKLRLSKLMAERGLCSRREADEWIANGWVLVDGEVVDQLGSKVSPDVEIEISALAQQQQDRWVTILVNKPIGYVSGQPEKDYEPAVRLITPENQEREHGDGKLERRHFEGLAPAGRLDIDSQGLLVFTQNGQIAKQLIGESSNVEKEYLVRVQGDIGKQELALLNHGLELDCVPLRPAKVDWANEDQLRFVLNEGKKRQIRRMCEAVGLKVVGLKRVRIGRVMLGRLPEGKWRFLRPEERF